MSLEKLLDLNDIPKDGESLRIEYDHPYTEISYILGVFHIKDKYYVVADDCKKCGCSLAKGTLDGLIAKCTLEEHPWNVKTGLFKFDRSMGLNTYRSYLKDDGLYIEI